MASPNGSGWNFETSQDAGTYAPYSRHTGEAYRARAQGGTRYNEPVRSYGYGPYPDRPYGAPDAW